MRKAEFEALAGYEVTNKDYDEYIEPMYMALNVSKEEFVGMVSKERFAMKTKQQLLKEARRLAKSLKATCDSYTDTETEQALKDVLADLASRYYYGMAKFQITTKMCYGTFGCSYPASVEIYSPKRFETLDSFELA